MPMDSLIDLIGRIAYRCIDVLGGRIAFAPEHIEAIG